MKPTVPLLILLACISLSMIPDSQGVPVPQTAFPKEPNLIQTAQDDYYIDEDDDVDPEGCKPSCKNGGFCEKRQCYCPNGYLGNSCQIYKPVGYRFEQFAVIPICIGTFILGLSLSCGCWLMFKKKDLKNETIQLKKKLYEFGGEDDEDVE